MSFKGSMVLALKNNSLLRSIPQRTSDFTKNIINASQSYSPKYMLNKTQNFHQSSSFLKGFDDFLDPPRKPTEVFSAGRGWTLADLRRKDFDDLHKLWYVLYKERNLLLTARVKMRRGMRQVPMLEENRYIKVKRSMAAIKHVLSERQKIGDILNPRVPKTEQSV